MAGKPKYDRKKLAHIICSRIADGETLTGICREEGMPSAGAFCLWTSEDSAIAEQYTRARESRADARADRIDSYIQRMFDGEIDPQQCRVAIDAEKWQAGKEQPKRYGDRIQQDVNHSGEINTVSDERLESRILELAGKAGITVTPGGEGPQG